MNIELFIDGLFVREGTKYGDQNTHPPIDQPTAAGGITLSVLKAYVASTGSSLPPTIATLRALTVETARPILRWQIRTDLHKHRLDEIPYEPLKWHMLDFSYNSGPELAIRWLQRVLRVPRTGKIDMATVLKLSGPWTTDDVQFFINEALVGARLNMIDRWTDSSKQAKAWEEGVESRGLIFSQLEVP